MILITEDLDKAVQNKNIYIDSDFLGALFNIEEMLEYCVKLFSKSVLLVDKFVEFEFLRDIFIPEQKIIFEKFLANSFFNKSIWHQDILNKIFNNALVLSKVYSHNLKNHTWSLVDLLLAGRVMFDKNLSLLVTGNLSDYPSCIFNLVGVISYRNDLNNSNRSFYVLSFNKDGFESNFNKLEVLEEAYRKRLKEASKIDFDQILF